MKKYRTTASILLPAGAKLELSARQAEDRAHLVEKRGKIYVAKEMLHFKAGETIGIVEPEKLTKAALLRLEEIGKAKAKEETPPPPDPAPDPAEEDETDGEEQAEAFDPLKG